MHQLLVLTPTDKSPTPLAATKPRDDSRTRARKAQSGTENTGGKRDVEKARAKESERERARTRETEKREWLIYFSNSFEFLQRFWVGTGDKGFMHKQPCLLSLSSGNVEDLASVAEAWREPEVLLRAQRRVFIPCPVFSYVIPKYRTFKLNLDDKMPSVIGERVVLRDLFSGLFSAFIIEIHSSWANSD